jgi:hypothetical protein
VPGATAPLSTPATGGATSASRCASARRSRPRRRPAPGRRARGERRGQRAPERVGGERLLRQHADGGAVEAEGLEGLPPAGDHRGGEPRERPALPSADRRPPGRGRPGMAGPSRRRGTGTAPRARPPRRRPSAAGSRGRRASRPRSARPPSPSWSRARPRPRRASRSRPCPPRPRSRARRSMVEARIEPRRRQAVAGLGVSRLQLGDDGGLVEPGRAGDLAEGSCSSPTSSARRRPGPTCRSASARSGWCAPARPSPVAKASRSPPAFIRRAWNRPSRKVAMTSPASSTRVAALVRRQAGAVTAKGDAALGAGHMLLEGWATSLADRLARTGGSRRRRGRPRPSSAGPGTGPRARWR